MASFCRTELNYVPAGALDGPAPRTVEIRDGRQADLPPWQQSGFELVPHASAVRDWADDEELVAVHHPEIEELAQRMTGCDHALVPSHIKRSPDEATRHQDLSPITFVHSDFAASYLEVLRRSYANAKSEGFQRALTRHGLQASDIENARRVVILQFWRNIGPAKMDFPLAFCDARTVRPDEARPIPVNDYAGLGIDFEALAVAAPEDPDRHHWYAFPELQPDETVAFRTFDTDLVQAGETFFTPHSAFHDPEVPVGRPSRSSIELRATCLFT